MKKLNLLLRYLIIGFVIYLILYLIFGMLYMFYVEPKVWELNDNICKSECFLRNDSSNFIKCLGCFDKAKYCDCVYGLAQTYSSRNCMRDSCVYP